MRKFLQPRAQTVGLPAGTLVHVGERKVERTLVTLLDYDEDHFEERELAAVAECAPYKDGPRVTWISVEGLHDVELIEELGRLFGLHPLVQEDLLSTDQRPKLDDLDDYLCLIVKMLYCDPDTDEVVAEHVGVILGPNFVLSFQEEGRDVFAAVRERLRAGKGRLRGLGADHLAYVLLDTVVDNYFTVLESLGESIEPLEEEMLEDPSPETLSEIHGLRRELIFLRKSVWPLREVISGLERDDTPLVSRATRPYLRDVYDHTIQVMDTIETFRDMVAGMLDIYLSSVSNKLNAVMKVLTIIATIFMPLSFLAGVYGMNFKHMPELDWRWGYPAVWALMVLVTIGMIVYFRRRKWV